MDESGHLVWEPKLVYWCLKASGYAADIGKIFIQCVTQGAAASTQEVVLIFSYMDVSVYWSWCVLCVFVSVCVCVCVCVTSNQSTNKKPHHVLDLSKLMPCCIKHTTMSLWYYKA